MRVCHSAPASRASARCRSPFFLVAVVVRWNFKPRKKIRRLAVDFRSTCAAHRMTFRQGPQPTGQAHWWSNSRGTSGDPLGERGGLPPSLRAIRGEKQQRGPGTSTRGARRPVIGPGQLDLPCRGEAMGGDGQQSLLGGPRLSYMPPVRQSGTLKSQSPGAKVNSTS